MSEISISSALIAPAADKPLTPAMTRVVWEISALLDERRDVPDLPSDAVWLTCPASRMRRAGRPDNHWLREVLDRLTGVRITGEHRGDPWGAVLVAEWRITEGGSRVEILVPPAAIAALRSPRTFAKVEALAVHRLPGHAARLYAALADRRRQKRNNWTYDIEELRRLFGVHNRASYQRFNTFRERVLQPAINAICDLGTVDLRVEYIREARRIRKVRIHWAWKSPQDAADTMHEAERHTLARRRQPPKNPDAPPLLANPDNADPAAAWWDSLTEDEREEWRDRVGRQFEFGGVILKRRERDFREIAYKMTVQNDCPETDPDS